MTDGHGKQLTQLGVLPKTTKVLMLSDITICKAEGTNDKFTFPADNTLPWAGGAGAFPGNSERDDPDELCETNVRDEQDNSLLAEGDIPNVMPIPGVTANRVNEGQIVLVNGRQPAPRAGGPASDTNSTMEVLAPQVGLSRSAR